MGYAITQPVDLTGIARTSDLAGVAREPSNEVIYAALSASSVPSIFGGGSDGDVVITGGTTTLTRDMFYNNLTITGTGILRTAGFRVFVNQTFTIDAGGVVHNNGNAGPPTSDGAGGLGARLGAGGTGGARQALGGGSGASRNPSLGGAGGNSGNGAVQPGAGGGTATGGPLVFSAPTGAGLLALSDLFGGAGGASGGGDNVGVSSGGGGGGGGIIVIAARALVLNGSIRVNGGAGANGAANAGGGGGGGGGMVLLIYGSKAGPGTTLANGGAAGLGGAGGTNGLAGQAGTITEVHVR